jgi:hypothetical protein
MKKGLCEIICVVDRSGSMGSIREDAIGAFNTYLEGQQKSPAEILLTYAQFDDVYEVVHNGKAIKDVPKLTHETYVPRGSTALLDAVGKTIDTVGARLAATLDGERPERVLFVIITDGGENSSREYTRKQVFDKISHQRDTYKWEFVFLAAGQDAFDEAQAIGILKGQVHVYAAMNAGAHHAAVQKLSATTDSYTSGGSADLST